MVTVEVEVEVEVELEVVVVVEVGVERLADILLIWGGSGVAGIRSKLRLPCNAARPM